MRKLFMTVAMLFVAFMAVANTNVTVEAKAKEMVAKLQKATSEAEAMAIVAPYESYYNSLSAADKAKFDAILNQLLNAPTAEAKAQKSEATSVEKKATEIANKLVAAIKAGDMAAVEKISAEGDAYIATLSEADKAKFDEVVGKIAIAAGLN